MIEHDPGVTPEHGQFKATCSCGWRTECTYKNQNDALRQAKGHAIYEAGRAWAKAEHLQAIERDNDKCE